MSEPKTSPQTTRVVLNDDAGGTLTASELAARLGVPLDEVQRFTTLSGFPCQEGGKFNLQAVHAWMQRTATRPRAVRL